jgi:hypothetical protein
MYFTMRISKKPNGKLYLLQIIEKQALLIILK